MKRTITEDQIVDFIFDRPADKAVNMREPCSSDPCGCVMVQYAKEKLKGFKYRYFNCSFQSLTYKAGERNMTKNLEVSICSIIDPDQWLNIKKYGDIQKLLTFDIK